MKNIPEKVLPNESGSILLSFAISLMSLIAHPESLDIDLRRNFINPSNSTIMKE